MKRENSSLAWMAFSLIAMASFRVTAQPVVAKPPVKTPSTGGNSFDGPGDVKYEPSRDAFDRRIDMFIGDWRDSLPRHAYGSLVLRDILTRGDNYAPPQPGAVLRAANFLSYGRLRSGDVTTPTTARHLQMRQARVGCPSAGAAMSVPAPRNRRRATVKLQRRSPSAQ